MRIGTRQVAWAVIPGPLCFHYLDHEEQAQAGEDLGMKVLKTMNKPEDIEQNDQGLAS